jgi:hypothetical protein
MLNFLKRKVMAFGDIFKDKNDYNEKSIVGFASFAIMAIFAVVDLVTGYVGKDLVINEFIYNSFVFITLGSFGIAEVGKIFGKKEETPPPPPPTAYNGPVCGCDEDI